MYKLVASDSRSIRLDSQDISCTWNKDFCWLVFSLLHQQPLQEFSGSPPFSLKNFSPVPSPTDLLPGRGKGGKSRERQRPPAPGLQDHHYHQEAKDSASPGPAPPPSWTTADHPTTRTWPGTVRPAVNASVVGPASATSECTTWRRVLLILASFSTQ